MARRSDAVLPTGQKCFYSTYMKVIGADDSEEGSGTVYSRRHPSRLSCPPRRSRRRRPRQVLHQRPRRPRRRPEQRPHSLRHPPHCGPSCCRPSSVAASPASVALRSATCDASRWRADAGGPRTLGTHRALTVQADGHAAAAASNSSSDSSVIKNRIWELRCAQYKRSTRIENIRLTLLS